MKRPNNRTLLGLVRLLEDHETAVQVVSYTRADGNEEDAFGTMRPGVDYWPLHDLPARKGGAAPGVGFDTTKEHIRFTNTTGTIALMWPASWTYQSDDDGNAIVATRQNRTGGDKLVIRLHQPNVLAANWSASLDHDRIEND